MSAASRHRRSSLPPPPPPAAPFPDDDDLLLEILLRLPPLPSSIPRASLVCKRWLRLLSDPHFLCRFRAHHHREAPLLGFFTGFGDPYFTPTLDPPDRIPTERLDLPLPRDDHWSLLGCRHGLALLLSRTTRLEVTVWDPVAEDQRRVAVPPELFGNEGANTLWHGALVCDDGRGSPLEAFNLVLLRSDDWWFDGDPQVFASFYESETGVWSNLISTSIRAPLSQRTPSILAGNSLCWLLPGYGNGGGILEFDLDRKSLAVIEYPVGARVKQHSNFQILRMEDGALGLAILSGRIQLWERKFSSNGVATWLLQKTIRPNKLLSLRSPSCYAMLGYDEDCHVLFMKRFRQIFMIQLKTMQFKNLFESPVVTTYYPFTGFYIKGRGICSGDAGTGTLNNT